MTSKRREADQPALNEDQQLLVSTALAGFVTAWFRLNRPTIYQEIGRRYVGAQPSNENVSHRIALTNQITSDFMDWLIRHEPDIIAEMSMAERSWHEERMMKAECWRSLAFSEAWKQAYHRAYPDQQQG